MKLDKYSFGTGDRFGMQAEAQLNAVQRANEKGIAIAIVWNKSHREHVIVGTGQEDVRKEADNAVTSTKWAGNYYVDADHINMSNVDLFIDYSDFFTIDVADFIGKAAPADTIDNFIEKYNSYVGDFSIRGIESPITITRSKLKEIATKYLFAIRQAGQIYRHIATQKKEDSFITEISMDETTNPQTPEELFFILAAISDNNIPAQTIAPKFTGRFNKGVDYQGDIAQFNREFNDDVCVIRHAVNTFNLPENLKLSIHSGSDKFSIYPGIRKAIEAHDAGIHVKTAGTSWLEELIGLARSGDQALTMVKQIYRETYDRFDELCEPYSSVIDIDRAKLPLPDHVDSWDKDMMSQEIGRAHV